MSRCLVTGGAGFIGSHIVDGLLKLGHEVSVVDNESSNSNKEFYWRKEAKNHKKDILDDHIESIFQEFKPEYVFHLAAYARIPPSIKNPALACENNVMGTCNILQLSRLYKTKRVIYSSTSSVYGIKNEAPHNEEMRRDCLNPYSVSKSAAEDLCKMYYNLYGLESISLRYFNVYGERQPLRGQYAPVVGIFLRQKANGEVLTVVGDGKQRRDFTNVKDVVQANVLAMNSNNKNALGEAFNVGTGENYSILELAKMIGGGIEFIETREGEAKETLADISKINKILGYSPSIRLEDYINKMYN